MDLWNLGKTEGILEENSICCSSYNTGFFETVKLMGDIIAIYCGHDHKNDFHGVYEGISLAYGRKTGIGAYGPSLGIPKGARVIQLYQNDPKR